MGKESKKTQFKDAADLLRQFSLHGKRENRLSILLGLLQIAMTILFAFVVADILDNALFQPEKTLPTAQVWLVLTLSLLTKAVATYMQNNIANQASIKIRSQLRQFALNHCFTLNIRLFPRFKTAELSNLLSTEINSLRLYFADYSAQKYLAVLMPIAVIIAAATVNWLVPIILALTAPLVPLFMILVGKKAGQASHDNLQQLNRLGNLMSDRLKNLQALQLAGTTEQEADKLFQKSESFRETTMKVLRLAFLSNTILEFFSAISVALVAVYLGLFFLDKYQLGSWSDDLSLSQGVFLLMLAPEFYLPLRRLGTLYHAKADATSVAEHLLTLNKLASQVSSNELNLEQQPLPKIDSLQLDTVQAGAKERPLHTPISITLEMKDRVLLNGPSGSGKTTLLDTLAGLYPLHQGKIKLNEVEHNIYQHPDWQQQIGYMTQTPELLFASIRENLCLGRDFSDETLFQALKDAQIEELISSLPGGLDYIISDQGGYLSGGQAQRIALARVFLHKPRLLLLDEPTANLDEATAQAFMLQLAVYVEQGGILIMTSHRPTDQHFFNKVITMQALGESHE